MQMTSSSSGGAGNGEDPHDITLLVLTRKFQTS